MTQEKKALENILGEEENAGTCIFSFTRNSSITSKNQFQVFITLNFLFANAFNFHTPVEDGTYYVITRGMRAASPILCPEHISKIMLATVMKFHGWIDLIKAECSAQEP